MRVCAVDGCQVVHHSNGYCSAHYKRFLRHGDPTKRVRSIQGSGGFKDGYFQVSVNGKRKRAHVLIAEKALGKPLPEGAVVHHWTERKADNRNENLVICPDRAYHNALHARMRAANIQEWIHEVL